MFESKGFEIIISSDLEYEELCAEIYFDAQFFAIVTREEGLEKAIVNIYPPTHAPYWTFTYSDVVTILNNARDSLLKIGETNNTPRTSVNPKKFRITIASVTHRDNLVAEIFCEGVQWAEISQELSDEMIIQFYSHPKQKYWEFPLEGALEALQQAKQQLLKMGSTEPLRRAWNDYEKAYTEVEEKCRHARIIACKAKANYILWVRFDDGVEGEVNLSDRLSQDTFKAWKSQQFWELVHIDPESKTVCWGEDIELDPCELKKSILVSRLTLLPPDPAE